jgi:hypothetical protein
VLISIALSTSLYSYYLKFANRFAELLAVVRVACHEFQHMRGFTDRTEIASFPLCSRGLRCQQAAKSILGRALGRSGKL